MTQDISSTPADSEPCMWGSATLVMLVSSTCMIVTDITDRVMAHLRAGEMGVSGAGAGLTRAWYRGPRRLLHPAAPCRRNGAPRRRGALAATLLADGGDALLQGNFQALRGPRCVVEARHGAPLDPRTESPLDVAQVGLFLGS